MTGLPRQGCGACRSSSRAADHDPDRIWSREQARKGRLPPGGLRISIKYGDYSRELELRVNQAPTQPSRNDLGDSRRSVEDAHISSATRWPDGEQERTDARLAQAVADIESPVCSANKNRRSSSVRLCAKRSSPSTSSASAAFRFCSARIFCSMLSRVSRR